MNGKDLSERLKRIIHDEVSSILINEESYKFGTLADPKDMDPMDPMVKVKDFGTLNRSSIRTKIVDRLTGALQLTSQVVGIVSGGFNIAEALS